MASPTWHETETEKLRKDICIIIKKQGFGIYDLIRFTGINGEEYIVDTQVKVRRTDSTRGAVINLHGTKGIDLRKLYYLLRNFFDSGEFGTALRTVILKHNLLR